jgi:hypothetical protein
MSSTLPTRACGACTACCENLTVDTADIQIAPGIPCRHCAVHQGCTIHETRPPVCRSYFCGWRLSDQFDDSWRPDRSGVLITPVDQNIPPDYAPEGIELLLIDRGIALARPDFFDLVFRAVAARIPLFLTLRGPPGYASAGVFLNTILEEPVANNNRRAFGGIIDALVKTIAARPFEKVILKHGNNKY